MNNLSYEFFLLLTMYIFYIYIYMVLHEILIICIVINDTNLNIIFNYIEKYKDNFM
jgi:hypothetical protein